MKIPEISNRAVKTGTGKTWDDWFSILDEAGAAKLGHRAIAAILQKDYRWMIGGSNRSQWLMSKPGITQKTPDDRRIPDQQEYHDQSRYQPRF